MPSYQCPTCKREVKVERREDAPFRPFCSKRCKLIDLYKWFEGEYKISDPLPAPPVRGPGPDEDGDETP
jgi:endogenous inhibitor of DNA gyrase (YacG/DUF329 family)